MKRIITIVLALVLTVCTLAFPNFYATNSFYPGDGGVAPGTRGYATAQTMTTQGLYVAGFTYYPLVAYTNNRIAISINPGESTEITYVDCYFYREYSNSASGRTLIAYKRYYLADGVSSMYVGPIQPYEDYRFIVVPNTTAMFEPPYVYIVASSYPSV